MNILERSSGIQLSYLETTRSFQILPLFVRQVQSNARFNYPPRLRRDVPEHSAWCPLSYRLSSLVGGSRHYSQPGVRPGHCSLLPFWAIPSFPSLRYLPHLHALTTEFSRATLWDSFSVQLSHLQDAVLPTTLDSQRRLLNSEFSAVVILLTTPSYFLVPAFLANY